MRAVFSPLKHITLFFYPMQRVQNEILFKQYSLYQVFVQSYVLVFFPQMYTCKNQDFKITKITQLSSLSIYREILSSESFWKLNLFQVLIYIFYIHSFLIVGTYVPMPTNIVIDNQKLKIKHFPIFLSKMLKLVNSY